NNAHLKNIGTIGMLIVDRINGIDEVLKALQTLKGE
ncbi:MAG: hypothetical protein RIQ62_1444, partial [Bacteroidota bacterium]